MVRKNKMKNITLAEYAKSVGATSISKVDGPNGNFLSVHYADKASTTLPIGGNSQHGKLSEYRLLEVDDNENPGTTIYIATANEYKTVETLKFKQLEETV